jgi:hypothetical protein
MSKLQAFYTTLLPRMDAIIQHLNRQSPAALAPADQALLDPAPMSACTRSRPRKAFAPEGPPATDMPHRRDP